MERALVWGQGQEPRRQEHGRLQEPGVDMGLGIGGDSLTWAWDGAGVWDGAGAWEWERTGAWEGTSQIS